MEMWRPMQGGIKVIRYGLTRDWVAGMRVVTGEGSINRLQCRIGQECDRI